MRPYPAQEAGLQAECQRARRLDNNFPVGHLRPACSGSSPRFSHKRITAYRQVFGSDLQGLGLTALGVKFTA